MRRLAKQVTRNVLGAAAYVAAGLAIATDTTQVQSANAVDYAIDGVLYTKSASDPLGPPSGDVQGNDTKALYLFSLDDQGNVTCTQSEVVGGSDDVYWPELPDGEAPVGGIKVVTNDSTTFDPGTDNLNKSGVTTTYYDIVRVPAGVY